MESILGPQSEVHRPQFENRILNSGFVKILFILAKYIVNQKGNFQLNTFLIHCFDCICLFSMINFSFSRLQLRLQC